METPPDDILDLLTAYALDALEPDEVERVSELLEKDPQLHHLLAEFRATVSLLPYALPEAAPSTELRQRVLDRALGRSPALTPATRGQARPRGWLFGLGGLAAACLVAAAIGWAQVAGLRADLERSRVALEQEQRARQQLVEAAAQSTSVVALAGDGGQGALFRAPSGETVLAANLPALPPNRVYQLWLIAGSGDPVSGGTFVVDHQGYGVIAAAPGLAPNATTFAVTEEPGPDGSPGPTSSILISGSIPSA